MKFLTSACVVLLAWGASASATVRIKCSTDFSSDKVKISFDERSPLPADVLLDDNGVTTFSFSPKLTSWEAAAEFGVIERWTSEAYPSGYRQLTYYTFRLSAKCDGAERSGWLTVAEGCYKKDGVADPCAYQRELACSCGTLN